MNQRIAPLVLLVGFTAPEAAFAQNDFMQSEAAIALVEWQLSDLGYDPGPKDGVFDDATRAAVLSFEKAEGLPQDGTITDALLNRMDELLQKRKEEDAAIAARVEAGPLAFYGIDPDGTRVRGVKRGSIADEFLGLKAGDLIQEFNDIPVADLDHLVKFFGDALNKLDNEPVTLTVVREGAELKLSGTLGWFYSDEGMPMPE